MSGKVKPEKNNTLLGIDYGTTNIGIALGREGFVAPLKIISGKNPMTAAHEIIKIALENKVSRFVIGLPLTHEGKESKQSIETRKFAKLLKVLAKKPITFMNEFDSTNEAGYGKEMFGIAKTKNNLSDHIAAALILKRFFEEE